MALGKKQIGRRVLKDHDDDDYSTQMMMMMITMMMMMMAAVTLEDYIQPCCSNMSDSKVAVLVQASPAFQLYCLFVTNLYTIHYINKFIALCRC